MNFRSQTIFCCCLLIRLLLFPPPALAQRPLDSDEPGTMLQNEARVRLNPDSRLYNGHEYIRNGTPAKGFPFFESDSLMTGSLTYDGIVYQEISLEYDLVLDELIIPSYPGNSLISLITPKIDRFSIGPHTFRYYTPDKTAPGLPNAGFFEERYVRGSITLLVRREKKLVFPSTADAQPKYDSTTAYYLRTVDQFVFIDGESALLKALKEKKDLLKKYIRKNKIRFKKDLENALVQTIAYYLQIKS